MVGIDPASDGLARAPRLGVPDHRRRGRRPARHAGFADIDIVFDATSARAHIANAAKLAPLGKQLVDLTPAAIGPYVVPAVNLERAPRRAERQHGHLRRAGDDPDRRRGDRGDPGALRRDRRVHRVKSAGPGTRANIDEFTETTARAIEQVGGAARGKAIIVLNPAEPPLIMRDTVLCLHRPIDERHASRSPRRSSEMVADVQPTCPATGSSRTSSSRRWPRRAAGHACIPDLAPGRAHCR